MNKKIIGFVFLLCVIGLVSFHKVPCQAESVSVGNFKDLKTYLSSNSTYEITLKNNIELTGKISVMAGKTIVGNGKCLYRSASYTSGYLIVIEDGSLLVMSDCNVSGNAENMLNPTKPLINVGKDAHLILGKGVNLYNNKSENAGGAILNKGEVRIEGANIYNCHCNTSGGAIQMQENSELYMSDGRIYNNSASQNGGAIYQMEGTSTKISGGSIYSNSCLGWGDAIYYKGIIEIFENGRIHENNDIFVINGNSLHVYNWLNPSMITLRSNMGVGECIVRTQPCYSAYFKWSSKQTKAADSPLCNLGGGVFIGSYYPIQYFGYGGNSLYTTQTKIYGTPLQLLASAPEVTGHSFQGWFTAPNGGSNMTGVIHFGNELLNLYARYIPNTYEVYYYSQGTHLATTSVQYGATYGEMPYPSRQGYRFTGWYTDSGIKVLSSTILTIPYYHAFYAGWEPENYIVTLDSNGGEVGTTLKQVTFDSVYGALPIPYRDGYKFVGWYTDKESGTRCEDTTVVTLTSNHTLYARWKACSYTVQWEPMEGKVNFTTSSVVYDMPYGLFPEASRIGYYLAGWYTEPTGGIRCDKDTIVRIADNHILYARWILDESSVAPQNSNTPGDVNVTQNNNVTQSNDTTRDASSVGNTGLESNPTVPVKIERIYMKGFKTYYQENQKIDTRNVKLVVVYSNNTKKEIKKGWIVKNYKKTAGIRYVVFQYKGVSCRVRCTWLSKKQVASIKLKKTRYVGYAGDKLPVKIASEYGKKTKATYKCNNTKIAEISKTGTIKMKKSGTAYITISMKLGAIKKTVKVKVVVKKAALNTTYQYGKRWNKIWFKATAKGSRIKPVYTSSNTKVAKINRTTGKFTALASGDVTITVKVSNLQKKYRIKINKKNQYIIIE